MLTEHHLTKLKSKRADINIIDIVDATHVKVRTEFGDCICLYNHLLKGVSPTIQTAIDKHEFFVNKLKKKFPELVLVFLNKYVKENIPLEIETKYGICKMTPSSLLLGGIPKAAVDKTSYFLNMLKDKNLKRYEEIKIISSYKGVHHYLLCETKYGKIKSLPYNLINKQNICITSAINPTEYFINQAKEIHGDKYDYTLVKYVNMETKVKIISKHGVFEQMPSSHLQGAGCPKEALLNNTEFHKNNPIGWSYTNWEKAGLKSKQFDSFKCYIIKCWNDDETEVFYKIGKTFKKLNLRFDHKKAMPYNYEVVKIFEGNSKYISKLESILKKLNKRNNYKPNIYFRGINECFLHIEKEIYA